VANPIGAKDPESLAQKLLCDWLQADMATTASFSYTLFAPPRKVKTKF
jgi:hypothetical protein